MSSETLVVSVRARNLRLHYANLEKWLEDPNNVYIGRGGIVFIGDKPFSYPGSIWENPIKKTKYNTKEQRIKQYEEHIREKIESEHLEGELLSLRGKTLGCWCKPEDCHGDVLVRLIEEYRAKSKTDCSKVEKSKEESFSRSAGRSQAGES